MKIKLENFTKEFRTTCLFKNQNLEIDLNNGEVAFITGENGSGKSTLFKIIAGILHINSGKIEVDQNIPYDKWSKNNCYYMPASDKGLTYKLTGIENIRYLCSLKGRSFKDTLNDLTYYADFFGANEFLKRKVEEMSTGQKRLVHILSALSSPCSVILLDEPTIALDERNINILIEIIKNEKKIKRRNLLWYPTIDTSETDLIRKILLLVITLLERRFIMKAINLAVNSMINDFKILFRYKKSLISDIIIFVSVYICILVFSETSSFADYYNLSSDGGPTLLLIGYIFWSFSSVALGFSSTVISSDARTGMLEVKLQGILPYYLQIFLSVMVSAIETIIILVIISLFSVLINLINLSSLYFVFVSIVLSIPSIIGMFGIGLILGGLSLKEKNIGQFVSIISAILLFLSNTLIVNLPNIIYIIPFTSGIDLIRKLYSKSFFDTNLFIINLIVCGVWFIIGVLTFEYFLNIERARGNFDTF